VIYLVIGARIMRADALSGTSLHAFASLGPRCHDVRRPMSIARHRNRYLLPRKIRNNTIIVQPGLDQRSLFPEAIHETKLAMHNASVLNAPCDARTDKVAIRKVHEQGLQYRMGCWFAVEVLHHVENEPRVVFVAGRYTRDQCIGDVGCARRENLGKNFSAP